MKAWHESLHAQPSAMRVARCAASDVSRQPRRILLADATRDKSDKCTLSDPSRLSSAVGLACSVARTPTRWMSHSRCAMRALCHHTFARYAEADHASRCRSDQVHFRSGTLQLCAAQTCSVIVDNKVAASSYDRRQQGCRRSSSTPSSWHALMRRCRPRGQRMRGALSGLSG